MSNAPFPAEENNGSRQPDFIAQLYESSPPTNPSGNRIRYDSSNALSDRAERYEKGSPTFGDVMAGEPKWVARRRQEVAKQEEIKKIFEKIELLAQEVRELNDRRAPLQEWVIVGRQIDQLKRRVLMETTIDELREVMNSLSPIFKLIFVYLSINSVLQSQLFADRVSYDTSETFMTVSAFILFFCLGFLVRHLIAEELDGKPSPVFLKCLDAEKKLEELLKIKLGNQP